MSRGDIKIIFLYIFAWTISSYLYTEYLVEIFSDEGYVKEWSISSILMSSIGFISIILFATTMSRSRFSYLFIHLMILLSILPLSVLCGFAGKSITYFLGIVLAVWLIILIINKKSSILKLSIYSISDKNIMRVFLSIVFGFLVVIYTYNGLSYFNLNFYKVYDFRDVAAENMPENLSYALSLVSKIMLPVCCVVFIKYKNYLGVVISLLLTVALFGFTSHKSVLFSPFLVLGLYYLLELNNKIKKIIEAYILLLVLSLISFIIYKVWDYELGLMFGSIAFRRALILPAELNYAYYEFFSSQSFIHWANSKITMGIIDYPYEKGISELVGDFRFPNVATYANTGWLGSGYAHAGFIGMYIYALIIGIFLKYADSAVFKAEDQNLATAILIIPSVVLITSSDLPTTLLSHGLLMSLIVVLLLKKA